MHVFIGWCSEIYNKGSIYLIEKNRELRDKQFICNGKPI